MKRSRFTALVGRFGCGLSALLFVTSIVIGKLGVHTELAKIPEEQRARMTDTDWIGHQWTFIGLHVFLLSIVVGFLSLGALWLSNRAGKRRHDETLSYLPDDGDTSS